MVLDNITSQQLQELILLDYEYQVKVILLFGWWVLSMLYVMYWYKHQEPTKILLWGTVRAILYGTAYLWCWAFWLLFPVYIHPNVPIDNLLIFLAYSYTGIIMLFFVLLVFNFTLWIPRFIVNFGRVDISTWEDDAIKEYLGKHFMARWERRGRK